MSIETKVSAAVHSVFERIDKKITELRTLRADVNLLMEKSRRELDERMGEISSRERRLSNAEEHDRQRHQQQLADYIRRREQERKRIEEEIDNDRSIAQAFVEAEIERFRGLLPVNGKLTEAYINALFYADERVLRLYKARSSITAADTISGYGKETRELRHRIKDLEYLLSEYWSIDEEIGEKEDFESAEDDEDATYFFISDEEYRNLSRVERNQLALDRYLRRRHNKRWIGRMYERYIGYHYEKSGYDVQYRGIELGLQDGGIDLICRKHDETFVIQCKNWRKDSTIYEKHICQLYGATKYYALVQSRVDGPSLFDSLDEVDWVNAKPIFATTTKLDGHAEEVAKCLGVDMLPKPMDKNYPMIKCNINSQGEKIYHLPFDQMYDKVKINKPGECYVRTVAEAEALGFRRAKRWMGD